MNGSSCPRCPRVGEFPDLHSVAALSVSTVSGFSMSPLLSTAAVVAAAVSGTVTVAYPFDDVVLPVHRTSTRIGIKQAASGLVIMPVGHAQQEVAGHGQVRMTVATASADQAIALAGNDVVGQYCLRAAGQSKVDGIAQSATVIRVMHVGMIGEESAVADDHAVADLAAARDLDLIAGIAFHTGTVDRDLAVIGQVEQVDAIGSVVADPTVFKDPVSTGFGGTETITVAAAALGPAAEYFPIRPPFGTAVEGDLDLTEYQRPAIGAVGADVAIPACPAVGSNDDTLQCPVAQASGIYAAIGHAVNIQVAQQHVAGIACRNTGRRPVAKWCLVPLTGSNLAVTLAIVAMRFDTVAAVGYFETGQLDVITAFQVDDHPGPLGTPQFRCIRASLIVSVTEYSGRLVRRRPAGYECHMAFPTVAGYTVFSGRRVQPHPVTARADVKRVAAANACRPAGRQGDEGMRPGAGLIVTAAVVGSVRLAVALTGVAAVGAHIPDIGCIGWKAQHNKKWKQRKQWQFGHDDRLYGQGKWNLVLLRLWHKSIPVFVRWRTEAGLCC